MLPKKNRLTKNNDFDQVFKKGKSSYNNLIGIKVIKNNLKNFRLGILISTKVSKKAVERNRIKRKIREIFGENITNIKENIDIVVITLPEIKSKEYIEIKSSIINGLKKLRVL